MPDYAYDQTPLVLDPSMADQTPQVDPSILQLLATMFQYPTNAKGVPEPYDLDTQGKFRNAYQDSISSLFDTGNTALTGGFSPGAFAPVRNEKQLDFPKTGSLQVQARMGGYQGQLAKLILSGMSPAQAAATIQDTVMNQPDNVSDAERNELMMGLPMAPSQIPGGESTIDWNKVQSEAANLATPYYEEQGIMERALMPNSGVEQRDGKYYQVTESPSPVSEWFTKQGLDTPGTQYGADYLRSHNPDFAGIEQMLGSSMGQLDQARGAYSANDAERKRQADLLRQFTGQDRAATDRFGRSTQNAMQDYFGQVNQDMLSTPAWGGGRYVGDPTVMPQLGQRTDTQNARDARLSEAMVPFRNFGAEGRIGATPESIKQALADYMLSASHEPMTTVAGHLGSTMVGGAGREGEMMGPRTLRVKDPNGDWMAIPNPARAAQAIDPGLPGLPQLSAYGDPDAAARAAMAIQLLGRSPIGISGLQRKAEQAGKLIPKAVRPKQVDAALRTAAYNQTHAAQLAYANAMLPAYIAQKMGRTPFQDQIAARAQSLRGVGAIG